MLSSWECVSMCLKQQTLPEKLLAAIYEYYHLDDQSNGMDKSNMAHKMLSQSRVPGIFVKQN